MKLRLLFLFIILSFTFKGISQEYRIGTSVKTFHKNVIYGTLGIGPIYGTILGNYERLISQPVNSFISAIGIRACGGFWALWEETGTNYFSALTVMTGRRASHLEAGAGLLLRHFSYDGFNQLLPAGNIGYRLQKQDGHFVLRAGAGWPEAGYVSLGFCF